MINSAFINIDSVRPASSLLPPISSTGSPNQPTLRSRKPNATGNHPGGNGGLSENDQIRVVVIRKGPRGFGFTTRSIRVYTSEDSDYYYLETVVAVVFEGSPAFEAGLRENDMITHVHTHPIRGMPLFVCPEYNNRFVFRCYKSNGNTSNPLLWERTDPPRGPVEQHFNQERGRTPTAHWETPL